MKIRKRLLSEELYNSVMKYTRIALFIILVFVEFLIVYNTHKKLFFILILIASLTVNNIVNTWAVNRFNRKTVCYVVDSILLIALTVIADKTYTLTLFIVILTEFYLSADKFISDLIMGVCSAAIYCVAYALSSYYLAKTPTDLSYIIPQCFNSLVILFIHFLIVNFAVIAYRKTIITARANKELDESNRKLQEAYEELKEVALLQERQRIAKDIHDTVGHSITTVIMQTEAAKMMIDGNAKEAKQKIVSANVQAKHALEELRESVHLLSAQKVSATLKEEIENIIGESCDGTGIKIRSSVEEIVLSGEKRRFIVNTLKEGISNGLRHGCATAFYFELSKDGDSLNFLLSDNGTGCDVEGMQFGLGLEGMKNRALHFGGKAEFHSEKDEGFEIRVRIPLDKEQNGEGL